MLFFPNIQVPAGRSQKVIISYCQRWQDHHAQGHQSHLNCSTSLSQNVGFAILLTRSLYLGKSACVTCVTAVQQLYQYPESPLRPHHRWLHERGLPATMDRTPGRCGIHCRPTSRIIDMLLNPLCTLLSYIPNRSRDAFDE